MDNNCRSYYISDPSNGSEILSRIRVIEAVAVPSIWSRISDGNVRCNLLPPHPQKSRLASVESFGLLEVDAAATFKLQHGLRFVVDSFSEISGEEPKRNELRVKPTCVPWEVVLG